MNRLGIVALLLGASVGVSNAETFDWSGIYGGVSIGARWSEQDYRPPFKWFDTQSSKGSGVTAGGFVGYNFTAGSWVFGPEVSAMFSGTEGKGEKIMIDGCDCYVQKTLRTSATTSVNGRLGYSFGGFLPYLSAGYSRSWYKSDVYEYGFHGADAPVSFERNGWNVGAGADWALTDHIFARAEYRYHDLSRGADQYDWKVKYRQHTATLGIAYKF